MLRLQASEAKMAILSLMVKDANITQKDVMIGQVLGPPARVLTHPEIRPPPPAFRSPPPLGPPPTRRLRLPHLGFFL